MRLLNASRTVIASVRHVQRLIQSQATTASSVVPRPSTSTCAFLISTRATPRPAKRSRDGYRVLVYRLRRSGMGFGRRSSTETCST